MQLNFSINFRKQFEAERSVFDWLMSAHSFLLVLHTVNWTTGRALGMKKNILQLHPKVPFWTHPNLGS